MKFFIEVPPLTGMADVMAVQFIGQFLGDGGHVIEAETGEKAKEKLLDLFTKRVDSVEVRPATDDEVEEFDKQQREAYAFHETLLRHHEQYGKGFGNEQTS